MKDYLLFSLSELLDEIKEGEVNEKLKKFKCDKEKDLESFLHYSACAYELNGLGRTFLFLDQELLKQDEFAIMGFFTIAQTSYDISGMSQKKRRKVLGSSVPGRDSLNSFPAFLIGQLGRSDDYSSEDIPGYKMLHESYLRLKEVSKMIGGKHVILECRECMYEKFYKNQGFKKITNVLSSKGLYTLYIKINFSELLPE